VCKGKAVNNIAKALVPGQNDGKKNNKCRGGIFGKGQWALLAFLFPGIPCERYALQMATFA
jgi:hypothetical protein